jgi:IclR family transcriptional regulator, KDG regulon repressor
MSTKSNNSIRSLDKAISILEVLAAEQKGLALREIARRLGFIESTTHHLLATLKNRGFVDQDQLGKTYRLGHRLVGLVNAFLAGTDLYSAANGPMRELRDLSGETSYLTVLHGQELVSPIELSGTRPVQARRSETDGRPCLHATASGKMLLAHLPPERYETLLPPVSLEKFTQNTISTLRELRVELETIRQQGYALDREEHVEGVSCVAVPVLTGQGECVATASVAYPTASGERTEKLVRLVSEAGRQISANLGYAPAFSQGHSGAESLLAT